MFRMKNKTMSLAELEYLIKTAIKTCNENGLDPAKTHVNIMLFLTTVEAKIEFSGDVIWITSAENVSDEEFITE